MGVFSKLFSLILAAALIAGVVLAVQFWWFKPYSVELFYKRVFIRFALEDPELLTRLRVLEPLGFYFHNDDLTDVSPAHERKLAQLSAQALETLESYDRSDLSPEEATSYDVLHWYLQDRVEGAEFMFHNYPVNQLDGVQSSLPSLLLSAHQITHPEDARAYIIRLSKFQEKFEQLLEGLELREQMRLLPPRFVVDRVIREMRAFIAAPVTEHVLYSNLAEKLERLQDVPDGLREALLQDAKSELESSVYPAYRMLIQYFEQLARRPLGNDGVWALPYGGDYYNWTIRHHTTTKLSAEEIHSIGIDEVQRIEREMDELLDQQGYKQGTVGERMAMLGDDPRFSYPDTEAGRAQILSDFQTIIDDASTRIEPYFHNRPAVGVEVRRVPEFRERSSPGAYYEQPPLDASQPGVFYVNLRNLKEIQRYTMRTLAYHEAVPGHHFQIAVQQERQDLPLFRRVLPFTAYVEGWALYAEYFAKEMGMQDQPFDDLGRLRDELFRAVRLVVDTGLHHKRWRREEAIAYMRGITGMPESDIVAEVERYLVLPGQALAYKIGMLKFLELRQRAQRHLGSRFDIRDFHDAVLNAGAMPLTVLDQEIERYIDRARSG